MLSELEQLLTCRRERENRAAAALRQARLRLEQAEAAVAEAQTQLDDHLRDRKERQDKLYRSSARSRLTKYEIDDLNIELDLMAEETETFAQRIREAEAAVGDVRQHVEAAAETYRRHRQASDRWGHLVDDVAQSERRRLEQAEEFAIEDDIGDRRTAGQSELL